MPEPVTDSKGRFQVEKDMKFAIKSIVAATAFVAAGLASAATVTVAAGATMSGSGALSFSENLRDALNVGSVAVTAFGGATSNIVGSVGSYTEITIGAPIASLEYDDVTNQVSRVVTTGGARQVAGTVAGVSGGGWAEVGNLDVRLDTMEIFGTIQGQSLSGVSVNFSGKLFDIGGLTGDTVYQPGTALTQLTGLALTTDGFTQIKKALDLKVLGSAALQAAAEDFGVINSSITVAVPEPSTYALVGAGLLSVLVARRRRTAK